jgi:hypothetical protein
MGLTIVARAVICPCKETGCFAFYLWRHLGPQIDGHTLEASEAKVMKYLNRLRSLLLIAASVLFLQVQGVVSQETQNVSSAPTKVVALIDTQPNLETLIKDLVASTADGSSSYEAIRIVSQIGRLGPEATPAVDLLISLLGKQFYDCDEELRLCPDHTTNCLRESRTCPAGAKMQSYDYLTPYAFAALQQIGVSALPRLSVALDDEALNEEGLTRRRLAAGVMGSIGPAAIPYLSDTLRGSDHSKKRLALAALHTVLSKDASSGNQLTSMVPNITSFLNGDFETTDQAIYILGAIGPGAAEAVPSLVRLLNYKRVLSDFACPVGERTGYIFQSGSIDALIKIGTPEALKAVEQSKER